MKTLLIVYHSSTGGTLALARAAATAATETRTLLQTALETTPAHVLAADGYIFATPENLAAISGLMKDFFDRCYYPALDRLNGRPYATLICAGSDGTNAARQITRIATGWRLKPIADPLITLTNAQTPKAILAPKTIPQPALTTAGELGAALSTGLAMGVF